MSNHILQDPPVGHRDHSEEGKTLSDDLRLSDAIHHSSKSKIQEIQNVICSDPPAREAPGAMMPTKKEVVQLPALPLETCTLTGCQSLRSVEPSPGLSVESPESFSLQNILAT